MAHRLTPTARAARRSLDELIKSLRDVFLVVDADRESGSDHIGVMIAHYLRMKAGYARWKQPPPHAAEIDPMIQRWKGLRGNAAFVTVAEDEHDEDRCITFNLVPGEDIIIGYANQKHEDVAGAIALRVANVLGYEAKDI